MPVHDWTRVDAGIFHDFHMSWITHIKEALNEGILPKGYYAMSDQRAGRRIADVLTLHASTPPPEPLPLPPATGGTVLAEAPPRVQRKQTIELDLRSRQRRLAIRYVSGHRLIALLEIVSPANKDRPQSIEEFADKAEYALRFGVNLLLVDLFPPGRHDPQGMHGATQQRLNSFEDLYDLPADEPLTLASYLAGPRVDVYLQHVAVSAVLPEMPLFLRPDRYINVPLETTYQNAYRGVPDFWRDVLEGRSDNPHP